ncbi:hypothetical protein FJZ26_04960 [Candidatus Parvarchaeota archaeon]|nr:hypothetical protein [Candidatus Parvarchaeota archaeon]
MAKATVAKPKSPMHKTREKIRRGEIQEKRPEVGIEEEQKQLERVWEQQTGGEIRPRLKPQRQITSLGEMLSQQLEEIKQQSERITQLRREKSKLLHGIYEPLANRMQSEIETVSEKLVEKESLILELERRAAQVPQLAQEVDTKQAKVLELERQAKGSLENAKIEVEDLLSSLEKLGQQAAQSMEDAQKEISASSVKLEQIGKTASKVDSLIGQTEQQIQQTKELIANQTESISQIEEAAASLGQYRSALEADMKQVKNYIERQRGIAKGLSAQIDTLSQVDGWVRQHLEDYERQVEELSKVTEQNEADFAKLREAVETNFVRRYISELQKLSSGHEFEINKAIETESALDARIAAEKSRLENLVRESKEIVAILQDESLKQADQQKILQQVLESKKKKLEELEPAAQKAQELKMALDAITFGTDKVSMQSGERKPSKKK